MFKDNEKLILLKDILNSSKEYEFTENEYGDSILILKDYYNSNKKVRINFNELILLLENYSGIDRILEDEEDEGIPLF